MGNRADVDRALAFVERGLVKCHTHVRAFNEVNEVLDDLATSKYEAGWCFPESLWSRSGIV